jgi:hypothetical protein
LWNSKGACHGSCVFDAVWTPTVLLPDGAGKKRVRLEGYLLNNDSSLL